MRALGYLILLASTLFLFAFKNGTNDPVSVPDGAIPTVYYGYIIIPACIDSVSGNFLLDTGTENLHLDSTFFEAHTFTYGNLQNGKIWGMGNAYQFATLIRDTVSFQFDSTITRTPNVLVHSLKPIGGDIIDGLIGLSYFSESVLEINYTRQYINVHNDLDSLELSGYRKIQMKSTEGRLLVPVQIKINEEVSIEGDFMIDLGTAVSTLTTSAVKNWNLNEHIRKKIAYYTKYGGVGGASYGYDFIANEFMFSGFDLQNVNMSYSTDTFGVMTSEDFIGILGNNILDRFDVLFDFMNNDLYLKPNENYKLPYVFDCLGFTYVNRNETMGGWIVTGLSKDSPAEKNDLRIDDKIISINGTPVEEITYKSQKNYFDNLKKAKLVIDRKGEISNIAFDLSPLLNN